MRLFNAADLDNSGDLTLTELRDLFQVTALVGRWFPWCYLEDHPRSDPVAICHLEGVFHIPQVFGDGNDQWLFVMNHLQVLEMILLFRNLHGKFVSPSSLVTQRYRVTFVHLRALLMSFHSWKNMRNICRQWWMKKAIQGSMPLPKSLVKPWNVTEHTLNWPNIYEHVGSI